MLVYYIGVKLLLAGRAVHYGMYFIFIFFLNLLRRFLLSCRCLFCCAPLLRLYHSPTVHYLYSVFFPADRGYSRRAQSGVAFSRTSSVPWDPVRDPGFGWAHLEDGVMRVRAPRCCLCRAGGYRVPRPSCLASGCFFWVFFSCNSPTSFK